MKSLLIYHVNKLIWHLLCPQQAWICWPIWLICNTIWYNAISKLSWKFGESNWNPCWLIISTSSSGTNYVICNTVRDNAISKASWKFGEPKWVIMLTSSSGTNYVPNKHEDDDQYDSYGIPSKIIPYVKAIIKVSWIKMKSLLSNRVNQLIWH